MVEHGPDDFVAVCNQSGDTIPLRKRDVVIFSLDFRRLAKELAATFEFAPMFEAIDGIPRCWRSLWSPKSRATIRRSFLA